jgi:hypothetical protein
VLGALFKILQFLKNISRYDSAWEHNSLLDLEKDYEIRINDIDLYESIGGTHLASSYAQINHYPKKNTKSQLSKEVLDMRHTIT